MITEAMFRAGWRECPSDEVRRAWEAKGGRWQVWDTSHSINKPFGIRDEKDTGYERHYWRPVHPSTWDYDCRGWQDAVPTEPGLWWRKDSKYVLPVAVSAHPFNASILCWTAFYEHGGGSVEPDGQWLAPCVKPEVMP